MKRIIIISLSFTIAIGFTACDQKIKKDKIVVETEDATTELSSSESKRNEIEASINPEYKVQSLEWSKTTPERGLEIVKVTAFLNEEMIPLKLIEYFSNGDGEPQGERIYYLDNDQLVYFQENISIWNETDGAYYQEIRTFYEDGHPVNSQIKYAETEDEASYTPWQSTELFEPSMTRAYNVLYGEGEFKSYFISTVNANQLFLVLGENKSEQDNRYTTTVMVNEMSPFIMDLLDHTDEYKFRPVNLQFYVVGGSGQPEYRVISAIEWAD